MELAKYDWRRTRQVVLSLDRRLFDSPEQSVVYANKKRLIATFMRELARAEGVVFTKWLWVREWHMDGYPHWHLFVEVDRKGKAGQIGHEKLSKRWRFGFVREEFIKSENHWKQFTSYFGKHGYFKKNKAHQSRLPEWAKKSKMRIRRFSKSVEKKNDQETNKKVKLNRYDRWEKQMQKYIASKEVMECLTPLENPFHVNRKPYDVILEACGQETIYTVMFNGLEEYGGLLPVPYKEIIKTHEGKYVQGIGYIINMGFKQFEKWLLTIECPTIVN
jgi:hypothetical protein